MLFTLVVFTLWHIVKECTNHVNCRAAVSFVPLCFLIHSPFLSSLCLSYHFLFPFIEKENNKLSSMLFIIHSIRAIFTILPWEPVTHSIGELLLLTKKHNFGHVIWKRCSKSQQVESLNLWRTNKKIFFLI